MCPPLSKRQQQLNEARKHINHQNRQREPVKADTDLFVLSTIVEGSTYKSEARRFQINGFIPPSETTFYRHQPKVVNKIVTKAKREMRQYQQQVQENANLSGDSRYSHRTNATQNTYLIVDNNQNKIVGAANIIQSGGKRGKGNYNGPCNMMETKGAQEAIASMIDVPAKNLNFAHDNDNKTTKILNSCENFHFTESLDLNHAQKSIGNRFTSFFKKEINSINEGQKAVSKFAKDVSEETKKSKIKCPSKMSKMIKSKTKGGDTIKYKDVAVIKSKLLAWFTFLVTCITDPIRRVRLWLNAGNHLIGNHKNCEHPKEFNNAKKETKTQKMQKAEKDNQFYEWSAGKQHPELKFALDRFLESEKNYVEKVSRKNTTQNCESTNSLIARTAPKNTSFGNSYEGRVYSAIGKKNNPHFTSELIAQIDTKHKVSPSLRERIYQGEAMSVQINQAKRSPAQKQSKNKQRKLFKSLRKATKDGDYNTKKYSYE